MDSSGKLQSDKLQYEPPMVVVLGEFVELTQGSGGSNYSDDSTSTYWR